MNHFSPRSTKAKPDRTTWSILSAALRTLPLAPFTFHLGLVPPRLVLIAGGTYRTNDLSSKSVIPASA